MTEVEEGHPKPTSPWLKPFLSTLTKGAHVAAHALLILVFVVCDFTIHHILRWMGDPALFDTIPWRYVADLMTSVLVGAFIAISVIEVFRMPREGG